MAGFRAETATGVKGAFAGIGKAAGLALGGIALAEGLKKSVSAASQFQASMELVHTQAGATQGEVGKLTKSVRDLAPTLGIDVNSLARGLFRIESAGLRGSAALKAMTLAGKGAQIGQADFESVAKTLANILESKIVTGSNAAAKSMGLLNAIVGAGDMRMQDLSDAMGTGILPVAKSFGISLQDVGGAIAEMTASGVPAVDAATRLRMTLSLLEAPAGKAAKTLKAIGISNTQLADDMRQHGLLNALQDLKSHLEATGLSASKQSQIITAAFGGGRTSAGIITLLGSIDDLRNRTARIGATAGHLGEAWKKTTETAAFQFARFRTSISEIGVTIGATLLPALTRAARQISDWVNRMQKSGALQRDFNGIVHLTTSVVTDVVGAVHAAIGVWTRFTGVVGGAHNALRILLATFAAFKIAPLLGGISTLTRSLGSGIIAATTRARAGFATLGTAGRTSAAQSEAAFQAASGRIQALNAQIAATGSADFAKLTASAETSAGAMSAAFTEFSVTSEAEVTTMVGALDAEFAAFAAQVEVETTGIGASIKAMAVSSAGAFEAATVAMGAAAEGLSATIKSALISTGIGALVVAIGIAVAYAITHWDKVKRYTIALGLTIKAVFKDVLLAVEGYYEAIGGVVATALSAPLRGFLELASKVTGWLSFLPGVSGLHDKVQTALDFLKKGTTDLVQTGAHNVAQGVTSIFNDASKAWTDALKKGTNDATAKDAAKKAGKNLGQAAADGMTGAVTQAAPSMTRALTKALTAAVQTAHQKILESITSAKQNLDSIGSNLAATIQQIQDKIGKTAGAVAGSPQGQAFKKLKELIESGAPAFEIAKAQAELSSNLQNVGKTEQGGAGGKKGGDVARQLADLAYELNKGTISYAQFQSRLQDILKKHGITMAEALKTGGKAFAAEFQNQLRSFRAQAKAIADLPAKFRTLGGAGLEVIQIVRPLNVIRQQTEHVAAAAQKLREAQLKQQQAIAKAAALTAAHTREIAAELGRQRSTRQAAADAFHHPEIVTTARTEAAQRAARAARDARDAAQEAHRHLTVTPRIRVERPAQQTVKARVKVEPPPPQKVKVHVKVEPVVSATDWRSRQPGNRAGGSPLGSPPGDQTHTQKVTPAHIQSVGAVIVRGLRNVCADVLQADKDITGALRDTRQPIEHLRTTEIRIADKAERQRQEMIREGRVTNNILRRIDRHKGPVPGFNKERPGTGSKHARNAAKAGVKV